MNSAFEGGVSASGTIADKPGTGRFSAPQPPRPPVPRDHRGHSHGGTGAGLMLVAVGSILLVARLVPEVTWWALWPTFFVVVGFAKMVTPDYHADWTVERVADGAGTVLFGLVLLGNTTGLIGWNMWWTFLALWPVLIVSAGVSVLGRSLRQGWLRALAPALVWAALLFAASTTWTGVYDVSTAAPDFDRMNVSETEITERVKSALVGEPENGAVWTLDGALGTPGDAENR